MVECGGGGMGNDRTLWACEVWLVNHHSRNWMKKAATSTNLVSEKPGSASAFPCFNFKPSRWRMGECVSDFPQVYRTQLNKTIMS